MPESLGVGCDDPRPDVQLLAATARDPEAFGVFYRRHLGPVLAYLLRRTGRRDLAADLAAETFAAALSSAHRYRPRQGVPRAWLFGIASHKLADSARRGQVVARARQDLQLPARFLDDEDLARVDELVDAERDADRLAKLLEDLPDDQRAAVRARVIEERDYIEIAAGMQCSEAVVRQRVSRGLSAMRRGLEEPS